MKEVSVWMLLARALVLMPLVWLYIRLVGVVFFGLETSDAIAWSATTNMEMFVSFGAAIFIADRYIRSDK